MSDKEDKETVKKTETKKKPTSSKPNYPLDEQFGKLLGALLANKKLDFLFRIFYLVAFTIMLIMVGAQNLMVMDINAGLTQPKAKEELVCQT